MHIDHHAVLLHGPLILRGSSVLPARVPLSPAFYRIDAGKLGSAAGRVETKTRTGNKVAAIQLPQAPSNASARGQIIMSALLATARQGRNPLFNTSASQKYGGPLGKCRGLPITTPRIVVCVHGMIRTLVRQTKDLPIGSF